MTDRTPETRMMEHGLELIGDPGLLTVRQVANLLTKSGKAYGMPRVSPDEIRSYVERGFPAEADGRINVLKFTAWLFKEWRGKR